jgi:hypothetical protein
VETLIVVINLDVFEDLPAGFGFGGEELIGWKTLKNASALAYRGRNAHC